MYIEDSWLSRLLDLAIFAMNPRERWPAHVTLAGPYTTKQELPREVDFHQQISTFGAGHFRSNTQNTVYLHVGSADMQHHIRKPDYGSAIPHITLYNGLNHLLGDKYFEEVQKLRFFTHFYATQLHQVESSKQLDLKLRSRVDLSILEETKGMMLDDFIDMPDVTRITVAVAALREALDSRFGRPAAPKYVVI